VSRPALAVWAAIAGCVGARPPADGAVRVGSKSFTESVVLGEVVTQALEHAGVHAQHRRELGGTRVLWEALRRGEIDLYPEYTGTLRQEILAGQTIGPADEDLARTLAGKGVVVAAALGFSDGYAIGISARQADRLGIRTISDLRRHPDLAFGFSNEFMARKDGWPGLRDRYGLPQQRVSGLDHDLAYRGIAQGGLAATDVYSTDAEIAYYELRVLEDDLAYFPRYDAILLARSMLSGRAPAAASALGRLAGRIDAGTMIALNVRAKLDRVPESQVAAEFLRGGRGPAVDAPSIVASLLARTREHLVLVAVSLLAAIAVALPLGILAARLPRLGQLVLAVVGVVQTIPSLALLVFMIPLCGIGTAPALLALFLYGLLPIVRATHAGLTQIPPQLTESALALGLRPWARLYLVELPLASRSILSGVKTSAVISVGTATLGAIIGAGGYGQPILTGIRLDNVGLILQGAVPAAVLALLVQGAFELAERVVVPRGLRLGPARS
jgi:osmoprotectant transport system permease protein